MSCAEPGKPVSRARARARQAAPCAAAPLSTPRPTPPTAARAESSVPAAAAAGPAVFEYLADRALLDVLGARLAVAVGDLVAMAADDLLALESRHGHQVVVDVRYSKVTVDDHDGLLHGIEEGAVVALVVGRASTFGGGPGSTSLGHHSKLSSLRSLQ